MGKTRDLFQKIGNIKGTTEQLNNKTAKSQEEKNPRKVALQVAFFTLIPQRTQLLSSELIKYGPRLLKKHEQWCKCLYQYDFAAVHSQSRVQVFVTPWTATHQVPLSFMISQSLLKFMSIESVMLPNNLILCHPLLLLLSIFPSIRVFTNESALCTRWPKY